MTTEQQERKYIVIKKPFLPAEKITLKETSISLNLMQATVGGYIERVPMALPSGGYLSAIMDEEGAMKGKTPNLIMTMRGRHVGTIVGTVLICADEGEEFVPLTDEEARTAIEQLNSTTISVL
jgi:Domain of unknown function (DUF3846)